jgi:hypothetical protein
LLNQIFVIEGMIQSQRTGGNRSVVKGIAVSGCRLNFRIAKIGLRVRTK